MDCKEIREKLVNFPENGISDEEKESILGHLAVCPSCREEREACADLYLEFCRFLEDTATEASPSPRAWALIREKLAENKSYHIPIFSSIRARVSGWWRSLRVRPAWQQALVFLPMVAIMAGSGVVIANNTNNSGPAFNLLNLDIFVMNADGSNQTALTNNDLMEYASWSPDGTKIVFYSSDTDKAGVGNHEIYIMDDDGSNLKRLTNNIFSGEKPRISPDGTQIAFIHYIQPSPQYSEIYLMDIDGSNLTQITHLSDKRVTSLMWSPDGSKIVFVANEWVIRTNGASSTREDIYVMDADGSNLIRLTNNSVHDNFPAWSPDSTKIAFFSNLEDLFSWKLQVVDADGSNFTCLDDSIGKGILSTPAWSPDGSKIVYVKNGNSIWITNIDGSNTTKITNSNIYYEYPAWSPDGTKIAYVAEPIDMGFLSGYEIYVMNADGSNQTRLTDNTTADLNPRWSPDGTKILYASGANHVDE